MTNMNTIRKRSFLSALGNAKIQIGIRRRYPEGPIRLFLVKSPINAAREMLVTVVETLDELFQQEDSPIRIALEVDTATNIPSDRLGGTGIVKGLVVFDSTTGKTSTTALSIFPHLVRFDECPTYIGNAGGGNRLLELLLDHIESVIPAEHEVEAC